MNTVKEFNKAGLEFVARDTLKGSLNQNIEAKGHLLALNDSSLSRSDGALTVQLFAWRTNTGVNPGFNGLIDYEVEGGGFFTMSCKSVDFSAASPSGFQVIRWRPHLEKSSEVTAEEVAALAPSVSDEFNQQNVYPDAKPVFTQAMADKGELPPVESECMVVVDSTGIFKRYEVMYISNSGAMVLRRVESGIDLVVDIDSCEFKPIDTRTDKEKAVDQMFEDAEVQGSKGAFERLYAKGYRKC